MEERQSVLGQINALSEVNNALRRAFKRAVRHYTVPVFSFHKSIPLGLRLWYKGLLPWYALAPLYALLGVVFAVITLVGVVFFGPYSLWSLLPYTAALVGYAATHRVFAQGFAVYKGGNAEMAQKAFGVENLLLIVLGVIDGYRSEGALLRRADLAALLKITKAQEEHAGISIGFLDHMKKWLYGAILAAPYYALKNVPEVRQGIAFLSLLPEKYPGLTALGSGYALLVVAFIYNLVFSEAKTKREGKLYLLVLSTIYENWPEGKIQPTEAETLESDSTKFGKNRAAGSPAV
ncbi:hypothetical protein OOT46_25560 [Aquabacterium sp. A7-Y]|uniref:hypothetical protein n=1 Tax=Aquabacterium sp. A7-Y TaxID=1349605 RepID=UPI00223E1D63|nr:hypothetical protein [Aquabacterium sp. A7-Y]MCW7541183.1 hypothetical protein [Aquabacterium sp. A7-Y]